MNTQLADLMHRATENLEPVTPDLLERSVQQGVRLRRRRRRTTILGVTGASAAVATAGLIAGGIQLVGSPSEAAVGAAPLPAAKPAPTAKPAQVTPKQTLATLRSLIERPGRKLTQPETWGGGDFTGAAYVVDDGKGASRIDVMLSGGGEGNPCATPSAACTTLPDGSVLYALADQPEYSDRRNDKEGVISNYVVLFRPDGRNINLTSYNAPDEKGIQHTRKKPLFSVADLSALARSKDWKLPPVTTVKPSTKSLKPTK